MASGSIAPPLLRRGNLRKRDLELVQLGSFGCRARRLAGRGRHCLRVTRSATSARYPRPLAARRRLHAALSADSIRPLARPFGIHREMQKRRCHPRPRVPSIRPILEPIFRHRGCERCCRRRPRRHRRRQRRQRRLPSSITAVGRKRRRCGGGADHLALIIDRRTAASNYIAPSIAALQKRVLTSCHLARASSGDEQGFRISPCCWTPLRYRAW